MSASLAQSSFKDHDTTFNYKSLSDVQRRGVAKGVPFALHLMDVHAPTMSLTGNDRRWNTKSGIMGTDYLFRAAFAKWFNGGNALQETIYVDGRVDNEGHPSSIRHSLLAKPEPQAKALQL